MPGPPISPFRSLRHPNFRLFYTGQTISLVGTWMQSVALGWLVLELTDSAFYVGLVSALGTLPVLLFSLPAGVYVDRTNKRRVVAIAQVLLLAAAATLAVLVGTGWVRVWQVAALAAVAGMAAAFEIPARQSFIVELVGKDDLMNAIALNSSAFNATRVIGPAIAGIVISGVGIAACFSLNALSYVAVIAALRRLRLPRYVAPALSSGPWGRFREGVRFALRDRRVAALALMTAILSIFGFPYLVLLPVFARDVLGVGAAGLGFLTSSVGVGALAAALSLAAFGPRLRKGPLLRWAGPLFGLSLAAFAAVRTYPLALATLAVTGFMLVLENALTNTLLQTIVPDELRGRVMSFYAFVFVGMAPLGSILLGWMASRFGAPTAVALGAGVCVASALAVWRVVPEVTRLR
ncbi:MAG: MFS transporter [Gemmatimonadetes bacterium]|nr:MFS transporter [Gemmatimonadota bacterium]